MPLPLPNLDDRTYADLLDEARSLITALDPAWTNHNPSDPGITLVELFAWLTEMLIYRIDQVPEANQWAFLRLLNDTQPDNSAWRRRQTLSIEDAKRETVLELRDRYRAATAADYEDLATRAWLATPEARALGVRRLRARAIARRNLELTDKGAPDRDAPGHISLVVVPEWIAGDKAQPTPTPELCAALWSFLDERRLLTTRHHVVGPEYVKANITATLAPRADARPERVEARAREQISTYLHPLEGGPGGAGWPFGRAIYLSDLYARLEQVEGVDYVAALDLPGVDGARRQEAGGRLFGVTLKPHELVVANVDGIRCRQIAQL